jgi:hypothetical protein
MLPTTDEAFADFARRKNFAPQSVVLADGTKGHWLGSQDAEKVVVYFHGSTSDDYCVSEEPT